jgi:hypothetical protein
MDEKHLPTLLTPEQLATEVFQIEYDPEHIAFLRRYSGLPYVQFKRKGQAIFRYPREAVLKWIARRTHGINDPPKQRRTS